MTLMVSYAFMIAQATLLFLAVFLMIEYAIRRREVGRQLEQNRRREQTLAKYSAELDALNRKLARKSEIADQFPRITKKMTEKFPSDTYPAIAIRSAKDFFHAGEVGYFAPAEDSSDYTLVVGVGFPQDWVGTVRIHADEGILGMALQNATHMDPSRDGKWVDQLTGVSNRIYFLQRFEREIRRTANYRQNLALFMFDIDDFKRVNDTHGHQAGDVVIKRMAEIVRKKTRGDDLVGRYGGDEFMVLITSSTEEQAISFAGHLREKISTTDIAIPGTEVPVRITISGGLAMFPTHGQTTTELFRSADATLYESKRLGRNRILVATSAGLDGGIAKGTGSDQESPMPTGIPQTPGRMPSHSPSGNSVKI
jgi:diguanylate cyclase (GGDEF)-like protein